MSMQCHGTQIAVAGLWALCLAGAAGAQPDLLGRLEGARKLAVHQVRLVTGGLPVEGVEDGVVYSADLSTDCRQSLRPATSVLAGTLGSHLELAVSIASCEDGTAPAADPEVSCRWTLVPGRLDRSGGSLVGFAGTASCGTASGGRSEGRGAWTGLEGRLAVSVPETVGTYHLDLVCRVEGDPGRSGVRVPLLAIYQQPLAVVVPPRESWYALSTCWATGHRAGDAEADVLSSLVEGLYRYGQSMWYYGYAHAAEAEDTYDFPSLSTETGTRAVRYTIEDERFRPKCNSSSRCKCRWQGLVETGPVCNFADCYIFSDVLQAMAAVQGIGGLRYYALTGANGLGFVTEPCESLDPKFTGTVACTVADPACYPYYFSSHSLRLRDDRYYDSTFGRIYRSPDEAIALSEKLSRDDLVVLARGPEAMSLRALGSSYGTWNFYEVLPAAFLPPPVPGIVVDDEVSFAPEDVNSDGVYDQIVATLSAEVKAPGVYVLRGVLQKDGDLVAIQPNWWATEPTIATISGGPGKYEFKLYFSGQQIYQSGVDGPYEFFAVGGRPGKTIEAETPAYRHEEFGELGAAIQGSTVGIVENDSDGDGLQDELTLTVPFKVWAEGTYTLEARLAKDDQTIAYAGEKKVYSAGHYEVALAVPGEKIAESGLDSPYGLTVVLYDPYQTAQVALQQVVEAIEASDFE
jgi:hypothetical protein